VITCTIIAKAASIIGTMICHWHPTRTTWYLAGRSYFPPTQDGSRRDCCHLVDGGRRELREDGWRHACESLGLKLSGAMTPSQGSRTPSRLHHASLNISHDLTSPSLQCVVALIRHYSLLCCLSSFYFLLIHLYGDPPSHPGIHDLLRLVDQTHVQQQLRSSAHGGVKC